MCTMAYTPFVVDSNVQHIVAHVLVVTRGGVFELYIKGKVALGRGQTMIIVVRTRFCTTPA